VRLIVGGILVVRGAFCNANPLYRYLSSIKIMMPKAEMDFRH
jgi:hypothetical protein